MNFEIEYKNRIKYIDEYISDYLDIYSDCESELYESMKYAVLNGGKRLRSILCLEINKMFGGEYEHALPFAAAIELIHAYSLVHDDLPAMDNADYRRGQLSCHKKYGEAIGILCGDSLLNSAYEIMANNVTTLSQARAMQCISKAAGAFGMINGQVRDLKLSSGANSDLNTLIALIEQKTMALIKAAIMSGAYLAECDNITVNALEKYAYSLGLAFQIRDDFEDVEEDIESKNDSPNFINSLGKIEAKKLLDKHSYKSYEIIHNYSDSDFLCELHRFLFK